MDTGSYLAVIRRQVGGGGTNAVNAWSTPACGVEFVAANTDAQSLQMCEADISSTSATT
jgi:cell division protein FtsZ